MGSFKIQSSTRKQTTSPQDFSHDENVIAVNRAIHARRLSERAQLSSYRSVILSIAEMKNLSAEQTAAIAIAAQLFRIAPPESIRSAERMATDPRFSL